MIRDNLKIVTERMVRACERSGRLKEDVRLVSVTKEVGIPEAEELLALGMKELGENRVQELVSKYASIGSRATWHLIGHLQTNKVKDAVRIASLIHSVDSERLAKEIDKEAKKLGKVQDILIEVNVSGEQSKFGISPEEVAGLIKCIVLYPNISIKGLMTMAPEVDDQEEARPYFKALWELRDKISGPWPLAPGPLLLSMGMSNDFEVAIEEGANIVRVGRALFHNSGPRTLAP
jgi:pyridoxal phosphate enzyme (YggS family)